MEVHQLAKMRMGGKSLLNNLVYREEDIEIGQQIITTKGVKSSPFFSL